MYEGEDSNIIAQIAVTQVEKLRGKVINIANEKPLPQIINLSI